MSADQGQFGEKVDEPEYRHERDLIEPEVAWTGLPAFEATGPREIRVVITCDDEAGRDEVIAKLGLIIAKKTKGTWSAWYPPRDREDLSSLRFDFAAPEQGEPDRETSDAEPREPRQPDAASADGAAPDLTLPALSEPDETPTTLARPWPEHLGHQIALAGDEDGTITGARCSTCDVELPPPDSVVEVPAVPPERNAPEAAATSRGEGGE